MKGWSLILGLVIACGPTAPAGDAGRDGWAGEPEDAGVDSGFDAGFDAGRDATIPTADAGPMGTPRTWESASLYLLMVDRFANGADDPDDPCVAPSHPRRFHGGDLVGLREHLEYFTELGVDTLWVTPLVKQIGLRYDVCGYHGYWAGLENPDDGALEPLLGTAEDFDSLLESLHARDMRLVLDMVVNHAGYDAPITRSHPEWFHPRSGCEALGDPEETCPLSGLPDFDQSVPAAREYLVDHSLRWVERFDIDGIRMDTVKHVPLDFFRDTWLPSVRGADDGLFIVGELFDGRPYAETTRYLDAGFDGLFDFRFHGAIVSGLGEGGSLDPVAGEVQDAWHTLGPERARRRAIMLENHDLPRFASQVQGATASERVARMHQGLALLMLTPGIPQLYAGTELGMMGEWPENRRDMPAWAFSAETRTPHAGYLGNPGQTFELVRRLLELRSRHEVHFGDYDELWRPGVSGVPLYAFTRAAGTASTRARVIVALSTGPITQRVPLSSNPALADESLPEGALTELLGHTAGAHAEVVDGELELSLPANAIAVFTWP